MRCVSFASVEERGVFVANIIASDFFAHKLNTLILFNVFQIHDKLTGGF